jgi:hypothetical protein
MFRQCQISDFRRDVLEVFCLLGCYITCLHGCSAKFRDSMSLVLFNPINGTDRLSRNVSKQLPTYAAYPRRTKALYRKLCPNNFRLAVNLNSIIKIIDNIVIRTHMAGHCGLQAEIQKLKYYELFRFKITPL